MILDKFNHIIGKRVYVILAFLGISFTILSSPSLALAATWSDAFNNICTVRKGPDNFVNYVNAPVPCGWDCSNGTQAQALCWGNDYEGPISTSGGTSQKFTTKGNIFANLGIPANQIVNVQVWVYVGNGATCYLGLDNGGNTGG